MGPIPHTLVFLCQIAWISQYMTSISSCGQKRTDQYMKDPKWHKICTLQVIYNPQS
jgi:hypothetical protein